MKRPRGLSKVKQLELQSRSIMFHRTTEQEKLLKHRRVRVTSIQTEHVIVSTQAYVKHSSTPLSRTGDREHRPCVCVCVGVTNRVINFHASHCQNCLLIQGARSEMSVGKLSQRPWPYIRHSPNFQHTLPDNVRGRGPAPWWTGGIGPINCTL